MEYIADGNLLMTNSLDERYTHLLLDIKTGYSAIVSREQK